MFKGFANFIMRGNVIDLAVAVVIGAAFGAVVTAFVKDLLTPLIAAIVGKPNFATMGFTLHHARFPVGDFINALVSFFLVAVAIYYFVILPVNTVSARLRKPAAPTVETCPECLSEIPLGARRCKFCTAVLARA